MFSKDIIIELKEQKIKKGYTNEYIAEQTGVPIGTVCRVFSSSDGTFKYDTLQPLVEFLIGRDLFSSKTENPMPDKELIEFLKRDILQLKATYEEEKIEHKENVAELKNEIKQQKEEYQLKMKQMELSNTKEKMFYKIAFFVALGATVGMILLDLSVSGVGWLR